ncbi:hypothetical protein J6590_032181 [Homalodisca vitripennis]|nr:hypothetical protein J6590_032181 [Homalodisca vitripennis]
MGRTSIKSEVCNVIEDYARVSTLHGVKYMFRRDSSLKDRLIWSMAVLICVIFAIGVGLHSWGRYRAVPTVIDVKETHHPLFLFPFPTVTVCSGTRVKRGPAREILSGYLPSEIPLKNKENMLSYVMSMLSLLQFPSYHLIKPYLRTQETSQFLQEFVDLNITEFMLQVMPTCAEIFYECQWHGSNVNCCEIFELQRTEQGYCWSFNSLTSEATSHCPLSEVLENEGMVEEDDDERLECELRRTTGISGGSGLQIYLRPTDPRHNIGYRAQRVVNGVSVTSISYFPSVVVYVQEYDHLWLSWFPFLFPKNVARKKVGGGSRQLIFSHSGQREPLDPSLATSSFRLDVREISYPDLSDTSVFAVPSGRFNWKLVGFILLISEVLAGLNKGVPLLVYFDWRGWFRAGVSTLARHCICKTRLLTRSLSHLSKQLNIHDNVVSSEGHHHTTININLPNKTSAKILIHTSYELPLAGTGVFASTAKGARISLGIAAEITTSSDGIRSLPVDDRHCLFPDEEKLHIRHMYTHSTCLAECRYKYIMLMCRCKLYFFVLQGLECLVLFILTHVDAHCTSSSFKVSSALEVTTGLEVWYYSYSCSCAAANCTSSSFKVSSALEVTTGLECLVLFILMLMCRCKLYSSSFKVSSALEVTTGLECLVLFILMLMCRCTLYFFVLQEMHLPECGVLHLTCIAKHSSKFRFYRPPPDTPGITDRELMESLNCNCLATCFDTVYDIHLQRSIPEDPANQTAFSHVDIYYSKTGFVRYQRHIVFEFYQLIGSRTNAGLPIMFQIFQRGLTSEKVENLGRGRPHRVFSKSVPILWAFVLHINE